MRRPTRSSSWASCLSCISSSHRGARSRATGRRKSSRRCWAGPRPWSTFLQRSPTHSKTGCAAPARRSTPIGRSSSPSSSRRSGSWKRFGARPRAAVSPIRGHSRTGYGQFRCRPLTPNGSPCCISFIRRRSNRSCHARREKRIAAHFADAGHGSYGRRRSPAPPDPQITRRAIRALVQLLRPCGPQSVATGHEPLGPIRPLGPPASAELEGFHDDEIAYKLDSAERVTEVRDAFLSGGPWVDDLRRAVQDTNLTDWRANSAFFEWVDARAGASRDGVAGVVGSRPVAHRAHRRVHGGGQRRDRHDRPCVRACRQRQVRPPSPCRRPDRARCAAAAAPLAGMSPPAGPPPRPASRLAGGDRNRAERLHRLRHRTVPPTTGGAYRAGSRRVGRTAARPSRRPARRTTRIPTRRRPQRPSGCGRGPGLRWCRSF